MMIMTPASNVCYTAKFYKAGKAGPTPQSELRRELSPHTLIMSIFPSTGVVVSKLRRRGRRG